MTIRFRYQDSALALDPSLQLRKEMYKMSESNWLWILYLPTEKPLPSALIHGITRFSPQSERLYKTRQKVGEIVIYIRI